MAELLRDYAHCSVCLELFQGPDHKPMSLKCRHTVCNSCLQQLLDFSMVKCPECSQNSNMSDIVDDFTRLSLADEFAKQTIDNLDDTKSICEICEIPYKLIASYCLECEKLMCTECNKAHSKFPMSKDHCVKPVPDFKQSLQEVISLKKKTKDSISLLEANLKSTVTCLKGTLAEINKKEMVELSDVQAHYQGLRQKVIQAGEQELSQILANKEELVRYLDNIVTQEGHVKSLINTQAVKTLIATDDYDGQFKGLKASEADSTKVISTFSILIADKQPFDPKIHTNVTVKTTEGSSNKKSLSEESANFLGNLIGQLYHEFTVNVSNKTLANPSDAIADEPDLYGPVIKANIDYLSLSKCEYKSIKSVKVQGEAFRLRCQDGKLWCTTEKAIHVYALNLDLLETIPLQGVRKATSSLRTASGHIIVADYCRIHSLGGLRILDDKGHSLHSLDTGRYCDVSLCNGHLYGLKQLPSGQMSVMVFESQTSEGQWKQIKEVKLVHRNSTEYDTLYVCNNHIYICTWQSLFLYKYSLDGEVSEQTFPFYSDKIKSHLRLCSVDQKDCGLVANWGNEKGQRLMVCDVDGLWYQVIIQGEEGNISDIAVSEDGETLWGVQFARGVENLVKYVVSK